MNFTYSAKFHSFILSSTFFQSRFEKLSSTKLKKKRTDVVRPEQLIDRHAGVLGLSAVVQAYPYDIPPLIPRVVMGLSQHVDDPQPIQVSCVSYTECRGPGLPQRHPSPHSPGRHGAQSTRGWSTDHPGPWSRPWYIIVYNISTIQTQKFKPWHMFQSHDNSCYKFMFDSLKTG